MKLTALLTLALTTLLMVSCDQQKADIDAKAAANKDVINERKEDVRTAESEAKKRTDANATIDKANIDAAAAATQAQLDAEKKKIDAEAVAEKARVDALK